MYCLVGLMIVELLLVLSNHHTVVLSKENKTLIRGKILMLIKTAWNPKQWSYKASILY